MFQFNGFDPKAGMSNNNFVNDNSFLYNNLHHNVLDETLKEYSLFIDSKDRNYQTYPNPYDYTIHFAPNSGNDYLPPNPIINYKFENIKYIKLDYIILPKYTSVFKDAFLDPITKTEKEGLFIDKSKDHSKDLYTVMNVDIFNNNTTIKENSSSTNDILSDSFATIYYDHNLNETHYVGETRTGIMTFYNDNLGKLNKMRINFRDQYGRILNPLHLNKKIKSNLVAECDCEPTVFNESNCCIHNICHPLNPLYQNHINLKIGVIEPRINKKIFV